VTALVLECHVNHITPQLSSEKQESCLFLDNFFCSFPVVGKQKCYKFQNDAIYT
jgi:hypothetical protein